jgi:uncharacterized membrane protein YphA (DoxX/SURF4 family)
MGWGQRVFGLGLIALGGVTLALSEAAGLTAPKVAAAAFLAAAGVALQWRRTAFWASAAVAAYELVVVMGLTNGPAIVRHAGEYLNYYGAAEPVALAAAALIIFAGGGMLPATTAQRLIRACQIAFGACAVYYGGSHFVAMGMTAPLVPKWLPPSQEFWGYATGVFHIVGGLALISGVQARLAAILLTIMYAAFTPLVHIPMFLADQHSHRNWLENAMNIALTGVAWVIADSLGGDRPRSSSGPRP